MRLAATQRRIKEQIVGNNKDPNQKRPGEKEPGTFHFNPGNMSGKTAEASGESATAGENKPKTAEEGMSRTETNRPVKKR
jgi:hypothetical protein